MTKYYKLARPDGFDFYTGKTINYRDNIGGTVECPNGDPVLGTCSRGVIHASVKPNDCFVGASIPCSAYIVEGKPVCGTDEKYGFLQLRIIEEITDLDNLFGWKYSEACNPVNPLKGNARKPTPADIALLKVWDSVGDSVRDSVWASVWDSVRDSVGDSVWASVWDSVRDSVGASIWASVGASIGAYTGSLFPGVKHWKYTDYKKGEYPFQPAVDLWQRGFVPSFDGKVWRLHSGKSAKIVYEWRK